MKSINYYAIAEADIIFKGNLIEHISRSPFYKLVYSAGNGYDLLNAFRKQKPDIMLVDIFMPVLSGVEAIKFIRLLDKKLPIICYAHTYQADIAAMLAPFNFVIYCEKKVAVILSKLDIFLKGGSLDNYLYEKEWADICIKNENKIVLNDAVINFTIIELRLMKLTYEGFTNKEMATAMNLSTRTVDTYVNRLTEKLGLRSKIDLIRYAVENGLYNTTL